MNILIMGMGYVGVTTGLVFAELGWQVTGLDTDTIKIQALSEGELSFYEPGLDLLLKKHIESGKINFTSSPEKGIRENDIIFICVGTPPIKMEAQIFRLFEEQPKVLELSWMTIKLLL